VSTCHVFDFLAADEVVSAPVVAVFGDDDFLSRLAITHIRQSVLEQDDDPYGEFSGRAALWRDVRDELSMRSLFGGSTKLAVVDDADDFVSRHRHELEKYIAAPLDESVLVLVVKTWAANTRLYKLLDKNGLQVECRAPVKARGRSKSQDNEKIVAWLIDRIKSQHGAALQKTAAVELLALVGPEFGLLEQELAKLSLYVEGKKAINRELVHQVVGGWQEKTTWELLDAVADGDAGEALLQLDRLFKAGQHPVALFGQISWSLRRYALTTRLFEQALAEGRRPVLREVLLQAGFRTWPQGALERAEKQLKQIGRHRAGRLYQWLLEADLALKGSHSAPERARFVLERLFARLAKQAPREPEAASVLSLL